MRETSLRPDDGPTKNMERTGRRCSQLAQLPIARQANTMREYTVTRSIDVGRRKNCLCPEILGDKSRPNCVCQEHQE